MPPDTAVRLFAGEDLRGVAHLADFAERFQPCGRGGVPFFGLRELTEVTEQFIQFLISEQDHILKLGRPIKIFSRCPWMGFVLGAAGYVARDGESDLSLSDVCTRVVGDEGGQRIRTWVASMRGKLLGAKLAVLRALVAGMARHPDPELVLPAVKDAILSCLARDEIHTFLRIDALSHDLDRLVRIDLPDVDGLRNPMDVPETGFFQGTVDTILAMVGHYLSELTTGVHRRTWECLAEHLDGDERHGYRLLPPEVVAQEAYYRLCADRREGPLVAAHTRYQELCREYNRQSDERAGWRRLLLRELVSGRGLPRVVPDLEAVFKTDMILAGPAQDPSAGSGATQDDGTTGGGTASGAQTDADSASPPSTDGGGETAGTRVPAADVPRDPCVAPPCPQDESIQGAAASCTDMPACARHPEVVESAPVTPPVDGQTAPVPAARSSRVEVVLLGKQRERFSHNRHCLRVTLRVDGQEPVEHEVGFFEFFRFLYLWCLSRRPGNGLAHRTERGKKPTDVYEITEGQPKKSPFVTLFHVINQSDAIIKAVDNVVCDKARVVGRDCLLKRAPTKVNKKAYTWVRLVEVWITVERATLEAIAEGAAFEGKRDQALPKGHRMSWRRLIRGLADLYGKASGSPATLTGTGGAKAPHSDRQGLANEVPRPHSPSRAAAGHRRPPCTVHPPPVQRLPHRGGKSAGNPKRAK